MIHWLWIIPAAFVCLAVGFVVGYMAAISEDVENDMNNILNNESRLN